MRPPIDGGPCHTCEAPAPAPSDLDNLDDPGLPPLARPAPPVAPTTHEAQTPATSIMLYDQGRVPERSTIGLAISLVQNSSGRVLWHGKQDFQVKVDGSYNVERLPQNPQIGAIRAASSVEICQTPALRINNVALCGPLKSHGKPVT